MTNNNKKTVLATINAVDSGPRGGKRLRFGFHAEGRPDLRLSLASRFSSRSRLGQLFQASTGINPADYSGPDPLALMMSKQCCLVLEAQANGGQPKISGILPLPSPQLQLDWGS